MVNIERAHAKISQIQDALSPTRLVFGEHRAVRLRDIPKKVIRGVILSVLHPKEPKSVVIKRIEEDSNVVVFPGKDKVERPAENLDSVEKKAPPQAF